MLPKEKATSSVLGTIVESEEEARNGEQSSFLIQFCQTLHVIMSHCTLLYGVGSSFSASLFCYLYMVWFWAPAAGNEQKESLRMVVLLYVVV